ncbi:MAG: cobalt-precorrin 5A hydrolase [Thermodesulfobacteriota bacterium]
MAIEAKGLVVLPVTERGSRLAGMLERFGRPGVVAHTPAQLRRGGLKRVVKAAFESRTPLLFISASGIAVRSVAPYLKGKERDPAVLVMDEGGGFVVSLLSGHLGGANRLASELAAFFGATPVITTATDVAGIPCVEDLAQRFALRVENPRAIKRVNSALLKGERVLVIDPDLRRRREAGGPFGAHFTFAARMPLNMKRFAAFVAVGSGDVQQEIRAKALVLRPPEFVLGLGCRRGVTVEEVGAAVRKALKEAGIPPLSVRNIATIDIKSDEAGLTGFARGAGYPVEFYTAGELNRVSPPSGRSRIVEEKTGAAGVSEPSALISSGARRLWLKKRIYGRVTVAAAKVR